MISNQKQDNKKDEEQLNPNNQNLFDLRQKQIEKDLIKGRELIQNIGRGLIQDFDD